jgi:hypothetical protein
MPRQRTVINYRYAAKHRSEFAERHTYFPAFDTDGFAQALNKYMDRNSIPAPMQRSLRGYVQLQNDTLSGRDAELQQFPNIVRMQIRKYLYASLITEVKIFKGLSAFFLDQVLSRSSLEYFMPNMVVLAEVCNAPAVFRV